MISADDFPALSTTTLGAQKRQLLHDEPEEQHRKIGFCGALAAHTDDTILIETTGSLHQFEDTETKDGHLNAIRHAVKIRVAMDSGACKVWRVRR